MAKKEENQMDTGLVAGLIGLLTVGLSPFDQGRFFGVSHATRLHTHFRTKKLSIMLTSTLPPWAIRP